MIPRSRFGGRSPRGVPPAIAPVLILSLSLLAATPWALRAQGSIGPGGATLQRVSLDFARSWSRGKAADLAPFFAPAVRFTERGVTHDGARPMHVAETLERFRAGYEGPALDLERVEPMDPEGETGFAELVWVARNRESGTPRRYTLLVTWRRTEAGWRIDELRLIP